MSVLSGLIESGTQIAAGIAQKEAAMNEAALVEEQGRLLEEEATLEAERVATEGRKFRKTQKLAFLSNGVSLAGSPLLVLEETRAESQKEVDAIQSRGRSLLELNFQRAALIRNAGRAALISGLGQGVTTFLDTGTELASALATGGTGA